MLESILDKITQGAHLVGASVTSHWGSAGFKTSMRIRFYWRESRSLLRHRASGSQGQEVVHPASSWDAR